MADYQELVHSTILAQFSSAQFSHLVVSNSLRSPESQQTVENT